VQYGGMAALCINLDRPCAPRISQTGIMKNPTHGMHATACTCPGDGAAKVKVPRRCGVTKPALIKAANRIVAVGKIRSSANGRYFVRTSDVCLCSGDVTDRIDPESHPCAPAGVWMPACWNRSRPGLMQTAVSRNTRTEAPITAHHSLREQPSHQYRV
jgi:hypothetical protein